MKKNVLIVAIIAIIAMAFMAFSVYPKTDEPEKKSTTTQKQDIEHTDAICPCSKLRCATCGGEVEWTASAYISESKTCSNCKGTGYCGDGIYVKKYGCKLCDSTGTIDTWAAGCRCNNCNTGFSQPNDC